MSVVFTSSTSSSPYPTSSLWFSMSMSPWPLSLSWEGGGSWGGGAAPSKPGAANGGRPGPPNLQGKSS